MKFKDFLKTFWGGALMTVVVLAVAYFILTFVKSEGITFAFVGPDEIKSGEVKEFSFILNNNSKVGIQEAKVEIQLPEGVIAVEDADQDTLVYALGEIAAGDSREQPMELLIAGEPKTVKNIKAVLTYRPKTISSAFEKEETKTVLISGSSFNLELVTLNEVFSEQIFPLEISWENLSGYTFDDVEIRAEWPAGFVFQESDPAVSFDTSEYNRWVLGELSSASSGKLIVKGFITGQSGATKRMIVRLGIKQGNDFLPLAKAEGYATLIENPLSVFSLVNGQSSCNADLGETLNFSINYQNNYSATLRNAVVKVELEGDALDFSSIRATSAVFSSRLRTLTWDGARVPQLYTINPGESGTLEFSIDLKNSWPMQSQAQKNIVMKAEVSIESANIPEQLEVSELPRAAATNTVKLNAATALTVGSYFRDAASFIANSGSLPLRVNESTDFTIHWKISNSFNSIKDVTVKTTLPLWAEFTGQIAGNYGANQPHYDATTRQVSWVVDSVAAGSGVLTEAMEAVFQIKVTPSLSQTNQAIHLIDNTFLAATDTFTGEEISLSYPPVLSNQLTDKTVAGRDGIVNP